MQALGLFILKNILISGLLTSWYLIALRGRRLHRYNRIFLLSILLLSLAIPLLHFHLFDIPRLMPVRFTPTAIYGQPEPDLRADLPSPAHFSQSRTDWLPAAFLTAAGVSMGLLIILSVRMLRIRRMCRQYPAIPHEGIRLILTDSPMAPFTFLKYLFWNRSVSLQDDTGRLIFKHELTHIQQGHTYDKLSCQVFTCIFWFNPFYWIIQRELNMVHEFLADEKAVTNRDTGAFAMMLLRSYSNGSYLAPEHHFFSSSVKRRLAMLQNTPLPSYAFLRRFIAMPLTAGVILLFSFSVRETSSADIVSSKKKLVLLLDPGQDGKDICLKVARHIKDISPSYNVDVQLVRDNTIRPDVSLSLRIGNPPPSHAHSPGCKCNACVSQMAGYYIINRQQAPEMAMILIRPLSAGKPLDTLCKAILQGVVEDAAVKENLSGDPLRFLPSSPIVNPCY